MKLYRIDKFGVWFLHKGDEIGWLFPWRREKPELKWCSTCFVTDFKSLKELDKAWEEYFNSLKSLWSSG